jgi:hypothetical protein
LFVFVPCRHAESESYALPEIAILPQPYRLKLVICHICLNFSTGGSLVFSNNILFRIPNQLVMASLGRSTGDHDAPVEAIRALSGFIDESTLLDLASRFSETYSELARTSTEHFLVTPVTALPTGKEKGKFLSIDVGGTNLRVGLVELLGDLDEPLNRMRQKNAGENGFAKVKRSHDRNWPIEDHLKMDNAEDLFAWIADCIAEVVRAAIEETGSTDASGSPFGDEILLGVTFSFPMA